MALEAEHEFRGTERFQIERRLGAGGFGVVYRARDRTTGGAVALKTLRDGNVEALFRLKREFRALAGLSHPNLVALHELLAEGDQWFFTMELIEGVNFIDYVRGGPLRAVPDSTDRTEAPPSPVRSAAGGSGLANDEAPAPGVFRPGLSQATGTDLPVAPALDADRLRSALRQAVAGLQALHCAGQLHRDIKPSNVLITREERLVLLDFGMATDLSLTGSKRTISVVGTPAYMSPEQGSGHSLTEATDWYSLGVMLFEALTGQWPFTGSFVEMMWDKRHREAAAPRDLVPDLPEGLNALCVDLLRREPERRPNGDEILARLGAVQAATFRPSAVPSAEQPGAPFVGRDRELAALRSAFEAARAGRAEIVRLSGLSGSGKTALARRFLSEARRSGAVVLAGRCYERESVPYKALDSLVDALSQFLKKLPGPETKEILPRDVLALARLFPVLRRVEAVSGARRRVLEIPDSQELRRRAFGALRELLTRLAEQQDLVLFVDDLQWGDTDSAVLLADLLRPPRPPALLFLASYRSEATASSPFLRKFLELGTDPEGVELRDVPVDPLSEDEANYLTVALLGKDAETEPVRALEIARESGGNPLFLGELVRFAQAGIEPSEARRIARLSSGGVPVEATLDDMIRSRILRLPETSRRLLETLAVAGQPLRPAVARHSAGIDAGEALDLLLDAHLVRRRQSRDREEIEPYHDRIREAAVTRLSPEELRGYHHRLAAALEGSGTTDPEALALHFQEAGEPDRAAEYATAAADRAAEALAFDRAARLFRLARELRPPSDGSQRRRLSVRLGDALVNAGRGAEAAAAYLEAVEGADAADSLELQRRAAEQYLVSGHIAEGVSTLRTVLYKVGLRMAFTPRSALFSMLFRRALLRLRGLGFREKDPSRITAQTLTRIDVCWAAARGLTLSDLLRGADFQARHVLLALRAGEPFRAARALAFEVGVSAMGGGRSRLRTARLLEAATSVAHRLGDPYAIGFTLSVAGVAAVLEGRWKDSKTYTERAGAMLRERCRGVAWELDNTHYYSLLALFYLGELKRLDETLPALLKEAGERGDLYAATSIRTRVAYILQLVRDEPQRAREELREAISVWPDDVFLLQHWYADMGQVECLLYAGESEAAWDLVQKLWPRLEKSLYLRAQIVLVHSLSFRARTAIAAAVSRETDSLLGDAERDARRIEGEGTPWAAGLAVLLRAGAASARGQKPRALGLLATAEEKFTAADMALHATLARRRRGQLLPGVEGRALVEEADRWMSEQGVRNPDRMAAMLAPGAWAPR